MFPLKLLILLTAFMLSVAAFVDLSPTLLDCPSRIAGQTLPTRRAPSNHRHHHLLFAEPGKRGGSARFTGFKETKGATNALDLVLSLIVSDVGSILLGLVGLLVAVSHRLGAMDELTTDTLGQETRSDLLAVFACGAVLLNGVSKLDVTSALAETVELDGDELDSPIFSADAVIKNKNDLEWALESVITATPAKSVVLLALDASSSIWKVVATSGIVPRDETTRLSLMRSSSPILDRFQKDTSKETYLPTLQALPGKTEFTYLPPNTQEALLLPAKSSSDTTTYVLVLGSDTAKSFAPRDVAWCRVLTARIGESLV